MINQFESIINNWDDTIEARLKDNESKNIYAMIRGLDLNLSTGDKECKYLFVCQER